MCAAPAALHGSLSPPVLSGCGFLAVLLTAVFLEPVKDAGPEGDSEKRATPFWSTLLSTFKLLRDKRLRLLILLPMLSGFEQAFLSGDYTRVREGLAGGWLRAPWGCTPPFRPQGSCPWVWT